MKVLCARMLCTMPPDTPKRCTTIRVDMPTMTTAISSELTIPPLSKLRARACVTVRRSAAPRTTRTATPMNPAAHNPQHHRHRHRYDPRGDHDRGPERCPHGAVAVELDEPLERGAQPGRHGREAAGVEGGSPHDDERQEEITEEQDQIDPHQPGRDGIPLHLAMSPSPTRKTRMVSRMKPRHRARSTMA